MKIATSILALLLPVAASAQNYPGMSEQDMQNMMQHMQGVQSCMQDIDQSRMEELEQQANQVEAEVNSLCASGERDAAQQKAMAFAQETMSDPEIKKIMKCGEKMKGMMPTMPYTGQASGPDSSSSHVCD